MMKKRGLRFAAWMLLVCSLTGTAAAATEPAGEQTPIRDAEELYAMVQNPSGSYVLENDIDLKGRIWYPLDFSGSFEGNGHTISHMTVRQENVYPAKSIDGNHRGYETYYAGMFAKCEKAVIRNLKLDHLDVEIHTLDNCFAAGLAGYAVDTEIAGCEVQGTVTLYVSGKMCGVGGMVGYGYGSITESSTDVTLVLVDENRAEKCEEFLGGILACGYTDIENCQIKLDGYASVHGYVHNGGIVGMHHIHPRNKVHRGFVRYCTVDAAITFFEDNDDRRAYCKAYVGEKLNEQVVVAKNETIRFDSTEVKTFDVPLLPPGMSSR